MSYSLEDLAADCNDALSADPGPGGLEKIRENIGRALTDDDFVATHLGPNADTPRQILYEDPEHGFCIIAHAYKGGANANPHDHGPTWAVYGQVEGVTEMTDWEVMEPPRDGEPGKVKAERTYEMRPGDCKIYPVGAVHSPRRESDTKLLRVEGFNLAEYKRDRFEPAA